MPLRMWPQVTQTTLAQRIEVERAARLHRLEERAAEQARRRRERIAPWRMTSTGELLVLMDRVER
jgi:hypothetical protein